MEETKKAKKYLYIGLLIGVLATSLILTMVFLFVRDHQIEAIRKDYQKRVSTLSNVKSGTLIDDSVVEKADYIYSKILSEFYFEDDIDIESMRENMYKGIINSLNDKYAEYYTAEELADMFTESEGVYYGIGSYVSMDTVTGYPILSGVFNDSPAEKSGLRDGDIIYEVDGESIYGLTLTEVTNLIKGPENTDVELTIVRNGESDYLHITVTRGKVESPTVTYELKRNGIGYIEIQEFDDVTSTQFDAAYTDLRGQNIKALVIDLRSNGGGNLDTVLAICREILPEGIITYTEDKFGNREEYTNPKDNSIDIPLVILTNGYTASASELMSGAVRDYGLGTLIGTNTFGKGIVQTIIPAADGSGIKLTTSRYYTPKGECIHGVGIAPDIELEFDGDRYYSDEAYDNQLEYAIDYLTEKIQ